MSKCEFDWNINAGTEGVVAFCWVMMGTHDHKVINDLYEGYEQCDRWLVVLNTWCGEDEQSLVLIPCADDWSAPCDTPFSEFIDADHKMFKDTVQQLLDDEYYTDFE